MCGACEFRAASGQGDWLMAGAGSAAMRAAHRLRMAALASRALDPAGITVVAEPTALSLTGPGGGLRVPGPSDLWAGAAQLAGRPFDPLDPGWLDRNAR